MEAVLEQPRVTEQVSLKSYDSYYLDLCGDLWEEMQEREEKNIALIRLYKAVGVLVDEINRGRKSFKPTPRRRMNRFDYYLNKRYEIAKKWGHDPRYVSGKAPKRKDKPTLRMRMR